jgi:hypothetical protein
MKRKIWLVVWLLGIVLPTAKLGNAWSAFRQAFDWFFGPPWMHIVMHTALFAGLVVLLTQALHLGFDRRAVLILLGSVLGAGLLQEAIQALAQGFFFLNGALFDLVVDLSGGLVGYGVMWMLRWRKGAEG